MNIAQYMLNNMLKLHLCDIKPIGVKSTFQLFK